MRPLKLRIAWTLLKGMPLPAKEQGQGQERGEKGHPARECPKGKEGEKSKEK